MLWRRVRQPEWSEGTVPVGRLRQEDKFGRFQWVLNLPFRQEGDFQDLLIEV